MPRKITVTLDDAQSAQVEELARLLGEHSSYSNARRAPFSVDQIVAGALSRGLQRDLATVRRLSDLMARFATAKAEK